MFAELAQYQYQIGPWNSTNSLIVPLNIWNDMQFQFNLAFYGAAGLGLALGILLFIVYLTPASNIIGARVSGGKAVIDFCRDGTFKIVGVKYKRGVLFSKDGIHQVLPGAMHYSKGLSLGACWEEAGSAMPIEMVAALGMFAKIGIPDVETMELFNFYLKDYAQFSTLLTNPEKANSTILLPLGDSTGSFTALVKHAKRIYTITEDEALRSKFSEIKNRIPQIDTPATAKQFKAWRFPYWWNTAKGLTANVNGVMVLWSDIKNYQIYHQNPSAFKDIVDDESARKARKAPKQNAMLIIVAGVVIIVAVAGMVIAMKMMGVF
jgi:hypothetical protein